MTQQNLITAPEGLRWRKPKILQDYRIEKLPIVNNDCQLVGLITYKDILKKKNHPNACKDELAACASGPQWASRPI